LKIGSVRQESQLSTRVVRSGKRGLEWSRGEKSSKSYCWRNEKRIGEEGKKKKKDGESRGEKLFNEDRTLRFTNGGRAIWGLV